MNGLCARQHRDEGRNLLRPTFTRRHRAGAKYERKLVLFVERGERLPRTRACVYGGAQVSGDGRRVHGALRGIGRVPTAVGSEYRKTDCERVGVSRCGGGRSAMGGGSVGSGGYGTTRARRARVRQRTSLLLLSLVLVWGACGSDSPANTGTGGASATGGGAGTQSRDRVARRAARAQAGVARPATHLAAAVAAAARKPRRVRQCRPNPAPTARLASTVITRTAPASVSRTRPASRACPHLGGWSPPVRARPSFARTRQR